MADRWYSQNGDPAHAIHIGWDDYYHTKCGLSIGYSRPLERNGWTALGKNPDPGVKLCAACEKAIARDARQAKKRAVDLNKHTVKVRQIQKEVRVRFRKIRDEKREYTVREIQELFAPSCRVSKKVVRKIMTIVRRATEEEAMNAMLADAEISKIWWKEP